MQPLVITVALVGGELTRQQTPHLPLTPTEIAAETLRVRQEGAAMVHLHARDAQGQPRHDPKLFKQIVDEIRSQCAAAKLSPPIVQFSTGGSIGMPLEERMAPLDLKPDMATLTTGSVNFGADVFENSQATMTAIAERCHALRIPVELEIFDAGMLDNALALLKQGVLHLPLRFNFVLGVPGGLSGDPENLFYLRSRLPPAASWSVAGIGRFQLPLTTIALVTDGHVRVGLEDNIYYRKGELAQGNAPLVARMVRLAREIDREIATPEQARAILRLDVS